MKKLKIGLIILFILLFSISASAEIYWIVTQPTALYKNPGEEKIMELVPGYNFTNSQVKEQKDKWFKIEYQDKIGWITSKNLDFSETKPLSQTYEASFDFNNIQFKQFSEGTIKIMGEIKSNVGSREYALIEVSLYQDDKLIDVISLGAENINGEYSSFHGFADIKLSQFNSYKIKVTYTG